MKRIAINGSSTCRCSLLSRAFSAMTGLDYIERVPYSIIAYKYKLVLDKSECKWTDSFTFSLEAFTRKIMIEQKFDDKFISNGGVFNEISWMKCRYSHIDRIHERTMIESLEKVVMNYASKEYDCIFHITSIEPSDAIDQCLRDLYDRYKLNYFIIDELNDEEALCQMLEHLQMKPVLSAKYALLNLQNNRIYNDIHEGCFPRSPT